jgi:hypothetical protein
MWGKSENKERILIRKAEPVNVWGGVYRTIGKQKSRSTHHTPHHSTLTHTLNLNKHKHTHTERQDGEGHDVKRLTTESSESGISSVRTI